MTGPPRSLVDDWEGRLDQAGRTLWAGARRLLMLLAVTGWSALWLVIALLAWIFGSQGLFLTSGSVLTATAVSLVIARVVRRSRLARRAEHELIARVQLERLRLDPRMDALVRQFDVSYRRVLELLEQSEAIEERLAVEAGTDLARVRGHLFQIVRAHSKTRLDLKRLGRVGATTATGEQLLRELADQEREAEQIAQDCLALSQRLGELRALQGGASAEGSRRELAGVLSELDVTAKAYREIEASETDIARRIREARREAARQR